METTAPTGEQRLEQQQRQVPQEVTQTHQARLVASEQDAVAGDKVSEAAHDARKSQELQGRDNITPAGLPRTNAIVRSDETVTGNGGIGVTELPDLSPPLAPAHEETTRLDNANELEERNPEKEALLEDQPLTPASAAMTSTVPVPDLPSEPSVTFATGNGDVDNLWLLPPLAPPLLGKKCLVLDLDETLVHSSFKVRPLLSRRIRFAPRG